MFGYARSTMEDAAALLDEIAQLGGYFALQRADDGPWQPIETLLTDVTTIRDYTLRTRAAMASAFSVGESRVPMRTAASAFHLSIAAHLLSPVIGIAALRSTAPALTTKSLVWQPDSSHAPKLAVIRSASVATRTDAAMTISATIIDEVLAPFTDTVRRAIPMSPHVLWGNVISAANGASTVLTQARPRLKAVSQALVATLLAETPLAGTASIVDGRFQRRNCCLFYQVPGAGVCGDCVLVKPDRA